MKIIPSNCSIISKCRTRSIEKIKPLGMMSLLNNEEINDLENLGRVPKFLVYYLTLHLAFLLRDVKAAAIVGRPDLLDLDIDPGRGAVARRNTAFHFFLPQSS